MTQPPHNRPAHIQTPFQEKLQGLQTLLHTASKQTAQDTDTATTKGPAFTKPKSRSQRQQDVARVYQWLCQTFPQTFNLKDPKPLKQQINRDLSSYLPSDQSISKLKLRLALYYYTHATAYLHALITQTHRVDLAGREVEVIDPAHKAYAQSLLDNRAQRKKRPHKFSKPRET